MKSLPTRLLGSEKLKVTVICLGGWPLGGGMGAIDEKQAIRVVHGALDSGVLRHAAIPLHLRRLDLLRRVRGSSCGRRQCSTCSSQP